MKKAGYLCCIRRTSFETPVLILPYDNSSSSIILILKFKNNRYRFLILPSKLLKLYTFYGYLHVNHYLCARLSC